MLKLNLGCGDDIRKDYINVDIVKNKGVNLVFDMEKTPYPFPENTFDQILLNHSLEHTSNFLEIMKELHRISKDKAKIIIRVPYFASITAFGTPTHKSFFSWGSFNYFLKEHQQHFIGQVTFKILNRKLSFAFRDLKISPLLEYLPNKFPKFYERLNLCFIFPMQEIKYILEVEK